MVKLLYVVTGGSAGLGLQASLALARQGATVVVAARNAERLAAAVEQVQAAGAAAVGAAVGLRVDTSSLADVARFAAAFAAKFPDQRIAGLILNAGINTPKFAWSVDGVESTWATNHLGHFYLAQLLLPHMAPDGRIVVVSSGTHDPAQKAPLPEPKYDAPADVAMLKSDLAGMPPATFNGRLAYTRSKLCNLLFTYELARRLQADGSGITAVAYDPGFCPDTDLTRDMPRLLRTVFAAVVPVIMRLTSAFSGGFMARLASDPEFAGVTGAYYSIAKREESSPASRDEARQAEMWAYTEGLVARLTAGGEADATPAPAAVAAATATT